MPNRKQILPYHGTKEQEQELLQFIAAHRETPGAAMPVLQKVQEIFGYLPEEALIVVATELDIPLSELYGVASFYAQFSLVPKGEHRISLCLGTACYVKGSADILAKLEETLQIKSGEVTPDGKFSIDACRCIGACGLAPVMMIDDDVYGQLTPDQIPAILAKY
ncbi:MAG: NADH-quinone oxidoreductase subunit NuoE [Oscillospiraceae bacterium]|nr:NADH-quinone oxidoreductase subunit NuoE [Oscillospiraceae bacterium]